MTEAPPPSTIDFALLFDENYQPLHRYLARRVGEHIADDLASETFLVAYRGRSGYDPSRAPVRSWLYGIATNLLRRHLRDEERGYRAHTLALARDVGGSTRHDSRTVERLDAEADARRLAAGLAALSAGDRDVLLLSSWAGLDHNEIAAALGIPAGTVRSRLHRARRLLREGADRDGEAQHG